MEFKMMIVGMQLLSTVIDSLVFLLSSRSRMIDLGGIEVVCLYIIFANSFAYYVSQSFLHVFFPLLVAMQT